MRIRILLIGIILGFGCARRVPTVETSPIKRYFSTSINDRILDTHLDYRPIKPMPLQFDEGGNWSVSAKEILELSELLLETSSSFPNSYNFIMKKLGHKISQEFYDSPLSATQMTAATRPVAGNPYSEQAFKYAIPILSKKYKEALDETSAKVLLAVKRLKVEKNQIQSPEVLIQKIIENLEYFKAQLRAVSGNDDGTRAIIETIGDQIDNRVLVGLRKLKKASVYLPGKTSYTYLSDLKSAFNSLDFIPKDEAQTVKKNFDRGLIISKQTKDVSKARHALALIIDLWLGKPIRDEYPLTIKNVFRILSQNDLLALVTDNKPAIPSNSDWEKMRTKTNFDQMTDVQLVAIKSQNRGGLVTARRFDELRILKKQIISGAISRNETIRFLKSTGTLWGTGITPDVDLAHLVAGWLALSVRLALPSALIKVFDQYSDEELLKIRDSDSVELALTSGAKDAAVRAGIIFELINYGDKPKTASSKTGVEAFKEAVDERIINSAQIGLVDAFNPLLLDFPNLITKFVCQLLEDKKSESEVFAATTFHDFARYYLSRWIFDNNSVKKSGIEAKDVSSITRHSFPILEKREIKFKNIRGRFIQQATEDLSSAEILGLGLTNSYYRLLSVNKFEMASPQSPLSLAISFQAVSKMSVMMGYDGYDLKPVDSLAVAMVPGHGGAKLEIRNYKPKELPFAIPDEIFIKNNYKLSPLSEKSARASVSGQMELLRGYTKMMRLLKPWDVSPFDQGLGKLRMDEEKTLSVFSKEDLFQLSFGLCALIALNTRESMIGMVTPNNDLIQGEALSKILASGEDVATGAVITGLPSTREPPVVTTVEIAKAMIAIVEFYLVIEDIELTNDKTIVESLPAIKEARPLVRKLLAGMALFASSHLMNSDGGFSESFDFGSKSVSQVPRKIESQILMDEALLAVGNLLNSDLIRFRAVDNFFFLNNKFWNSQLGFYDSIENDARGRIRLVNVLRALKISFGIEDILKKDAMNQNSAATSSYRQVFELRKLWLKRFFEERLTQVDPVYQVLEFSL